MKAAAFQGNLRKILRVLLVQGRLIHEGCSLSRKFEKNSYSIIGSGTRSSMRAAAFQENLRKILLVLLVQGRLIHEGCSLSRKFEKNSYSIIGSGTAHP